MLQEHSEPVPTPCVCTQIVLCRSVHLSVLSWSCKAGYAILLYFTHLKVWSGAGKLNCTDLLAGSCLKHHSCMYKRTGMCAGRGFKQSILPSWACISKRGVFDMSPGQILMDWIWNRLVCCGIQQTVHMSLFTAAAAPYSYWWEMPLTSPLSQAANNLINCSGWRDCLKLLVWEKVKSCAPPCHVSSDRAV